MNRLGEDAKALSSNLEELIRDSPDADGSAERKRLQELMKKFQALQPDLQKVSDKSVIFGKAYEYKDSLEKRANWLDETQKIVMDEPYIDGLEEARAYLHEHEV